MPAMSRAAMRRSPVLAGVCVLLACFWAWAGGQFGWGSFANYYRYYGPPSDPNFSLTALFFNLSYMFAPLFLTALGLLYLSGGGRLGSRWLALWTAIMAACIAVSILTLLWADALWPMLWVPSRLDMLIVFAGHLVVGAAMTATLILALRPSASAPEPGLLLSRGLGFLILVAGATAFVATGDSFYVLTLSWWLGLFYFGTIVTVRIRSRAIPRANLPRPLPGSPPAPWPPGRTP
jgi:hypothetical protein